MFSICSVSAMASTALHVQYGLPAKEIQQCAEQSRLRISQRTTLPPLVHEDGLNRDKTESSPLYEFQIMVSEVGLMINSSSSFASGSTITRPLIGSFLSL
jgi:hypothetical protein